MENLSETFTHIDPETNNPAMVDVSDKQVTKRVAHARSFVVLASCYKVRVP